MADESQEIPAVSHLYPAVRKAVWDNFWFRDRLKNWEALEAEFGASPNDEQCAKLLSCLGDPMTRIEKADSDEVDVGTYFPHRMLSSSVGYMRLYSFNGQSVPSTLLRTLYRMAHAKALVIDLRGNRGGIDVVALQALSAFVKEGTLAHEQVWDDRAVRYHLRLSPSDGYKINEDAATGGANVNRLPPLFADKRLIVLIDGKTASAAELFAAALRCRSNAYVIGCGPSYGKGTMQRRVKINDQWILRVTIGLWTTPDHQWLGDANEDRRGLQPDLILSDSVVVDAALAHLREEFGTGVFQKHRIWHNVAWMWHAKNFYRDYRGWRNRTA